MLLEKKVKDVSNEKSFDKSDYFYGTIIIGLLALAGYLCYKIGQDILEKAGPYLDTAPQTPF